MSGHAGDAASDDVREVLHKDFRRVGASERLHRPSRGLNRDVRVLDGALRHAVRGGVRTLRAGPSGTRSGSSRGLDNGRNRTPVPARGMISVT